jgi:hypothetical protein
MGVSRLALSSSVTQFVQALLADKKTEAPTGRLMQFPGPKAPCVS